MGYPRGKGLTLLPGLCSPSLWAWVRGMLGVGGGLMGTRQTTVEILGDHWLRVLLPACPIMTVGVGKAAQKRWGRGACLPLGQVQLTATAAGGTMVTEDVHVLLPRTCDCVT